jgi:hypothetical protein
MADAPAPAAAAAAGEGGGGGDISWDIDLTAVDAPPADGDAPVDMAWDGASSSTVEWDIGVSAPAPAADAAAAALAAAPTLARLADDADARAALGDDVVELAAFVRARLAAAAAATTLPPDAPDDLQSPPLPALKASLADLDAGLDALAGGRAATLLSLRRGGAAADRLAAGLTARAGAEGKFKRMAADVETRAGEARAALARDGPKLAAAVAAVRAAKAAAEADVSSLLKGRRVNIVGEIAAVLASGESSSR